MHIKAQGQTLCRSKSCAVMIPASGKWLPAQLWSAATLTAKQKPRTKVYSTLVRRSLFYITAASLLQNRPWKGRALHDTSIWSSWKRLSIFSKNIARKAARQPRVPRQITDRDPEQRFFSQKLNYINFRSFKSSSIVCPFFRYFPAFSCIL